MKTICEYLLSKSNPKALSLEIPDGLNDMSIQFIRNNSKFFEDNIQFFGKCRMYDIKLDSYCNLFLAFDHKCKKIDIGMTYLGVCIVIKLKSDKRIPISVEFRVSTKKGGRYPAYSGGLDTFEPKSLEDALNFIETEINNIEYEKIY